MIDIKRKVPRFNIEFTIYSNSICGNGLNISQKGMGFLTEKELMPATDIPFKTQIKGFIFSNKLYTIEGVGNLLYSKKINENNEFYYNGFEFTKFNKKSKTELLDLLDDIRKFEKDPNTVTETKSLADFVYYPSDDISDKADIFYNIMTENLTNKYEIFSYYLDSPSTSTSNFIQLKTENKKSMIMMGSNNYLGLTNHPDVIKAGCDALQKYGSGNGSGAMVGGTLSIHKRLEKELAEFVGKEEVIIFNSGYSANVGIISGLLRPQDVVINDISNHASIFDGCILSGAKRLVFSHNDISNLKRVLKRAELKYNGRLIVINGVFSSNGEIAPLKEISGLAKDYNCMLMVDEAHGLGILGEKGIGASEHCGVLNDVDIFMGTMSKSLAGVGGFAAARKEIIEYLRFYGRPYLFSTNIPPSAAASILKALQIIRDDKSIREQLWYNINFFKAGLKKLNFNIGNSESAIIPIYIPDTNLLFRFSKKLFQKGLFHNIFIFPAVPMGGSLIRFGIMATHTEQELTRALKIIEEASEEENLLH